MTKHCEAVRTAGLCSHATTVQQRAIAAMGGACVSVVFVTPLDVVKTRLQTSQGNSSTFAMVRSVARQEGILALWRGIGLATLSAVPTVGIYLLVYEQLKHDIGTSKRVDSTFIPLFSGVGARAVAVMLSAPLENARTIAQAREGAWQHMQLELHRQGVRVLWRGFWPYLARDVPFSALYWSLLEPMRSKAIGWFVGHEVELADQNSLSQQLSYSQLTMLNFCCGISASTIAAAITTPVDVVFVETVTSRTNETAIDITKRVWLQGGTSAFFRGLTPRLLKIAPSCALVVVSFEVLKRIVGDK